MCKYGRLADVDIAGMSWAYDGILHERQNTMDVFNNGKSRPISWPLHDGEIEFCSQGTLIFLGVPHFSDKQIPIGSMVLLYIW